MHARTFPPPTTTNRHFLEFKPKAAAVAVNKVKKTIHAWGRQHKGGMGYKIETDKNTKVTPHSMAEKVHKTLQTQTRHR